MDDRERVDLPAVMIAPRNRPYVARLGERGPGGITDAQREAVRMYVWEPERRRAEIAQTIGVDLSTVHRWIRTNEAVKAEVKRQLDIKMREDDMFYYRRRRQAQETLADCLNSPYARDRIAAAVAILTRAGDTEAVRIAVDVGGVVRGGAVIAAADSFDEPVDMPMLDAAPVLDADNENETEEDNA